MSDNTQQKEIDLKEREYDIFKDSPLRYVGYTNELAEATSRVIPLKVYALGYFIEIIYFFSDAFHKGHKAYNDPNAPENVHLYAMKKSSHTIIWQFLATIIIPPLIINRGVHLAHFVTKRFTNNSSTLKTIPTLFGLSMIPIMPFTIDPLVDKYMGKYVGHYFN
jgi:fission process protein 1